MGNRIALCWRLIWEFTSNPTRKEKDPVLTSSWTSTTLQKICGWRSKLGTSIGGKAEDEATCSKWPWGK